MDLGIAIGIVIIVYILIEVLKRTVIKTDRQADMIPLVGVVSGVVISVAIFFLDQNSELGIYVGDTVMSSILIGAGSGLVATGGNQVYKKIRKLANNDYSSSEDTDLSDAMDKIDQVGDILDDLLDNDDSDSKS